MPGGSISTESKVGEGSSFTLSIPTEFIVNDYHEIDNNTSSADEDFEFLGGKSILVVDDDNFTYEIMHLYFKNTNVKILVAHNGEEGIN